MPFSWPGTPEQPLALNVALYGVPSSGFGSVPGVIVIGRHLRMRLTRKRSPRRFEQQNPSHLPPRPRPQITAPPKNRMSLFHTLLRSTKKRQRGRSALPGVALELVVQPLFMELDVPPADGAERPGLGQ